MTTHLLALGAGWAAMRAFDPGPQSAASSPGKVEFADAGRRPPDPAEQPLPAAPPHDGVMNEPFVRPPSTSTPQTRVEIAAERAAATGDIPGDLKNELAKVEAHESYDHLYARALIARWMKEDPAACSAWLGGLDSRVGWGDPFDAFVRSLPPQEALDLMENGWLDKNRANALSHMADSIADSAPAELPNVRGNLDRLFKAMPPEVGAYEATRRSEAYATAVDIADPQRGVWDGIAEGGDPALRKAFLAEGFRKAKQSENWSGFFGAVERLDPTARDDVREVVRFQMPPGGFEEKVKAALSRECRRRGLDDWTQR